MTHAYALWPGGDAEMAAQIRDLDWAATPLGPIGAWSDRLKLMVEQVLASPPVSSLVCGPERVLIYNDAAARLYGDRHPAALGRSLPETFPEGWAAVAPFYERAFAGEAVQVTGQPLDTRGEGRATDVVDALLTPVRETDGLIAYVHMTGSEVGDRARAEAALRESETRHRLLIESWAQASWEAGAHGVVVADSPSWRSYTGQSPEEWLGYGWLDAIHPDDRAYAERQWREAVAVRGFVDAEFRLRASDGGWRWTNVRAAPVLDRGGNVEKWIGINIDIDARKQAEAALRASAEKYRFLFGSMDEAYAVVEVIKSDAGRWADFRFLDANRAFMEHTSMPYPVGKTATELLGSPNPRWTELYGQALDSGEPIRVEETEPTLGRTFDLNIFTLDRERNRVAVLFTNITARQESEAALRKSEATLAGQREALELALVGGPLERSLGVLGRTAAALFDHDVRFAFYRANAEGTALHHIVGMPADHAAEVEGFRIGADGLACGLATYTGQPVLTTDVMDEPIWAPWRDMAARYGYRGCWSFPIHSPDGTYVGTFALYWPKPRQAAQGDLHLAGMVIQSAAIIIARDTDATRLRESEERFAQFAASSSDGLWIRDAATLTMEYTSPAIRTIYGIDPDAILGGIARWTALIVEEDRDTARAHVERARDGEAITHEFRIRRPSDGAIRWIRNTDFPLHDHRGRVERIGGLAEDVTEARELRERQGVLVAELQHRTRNLMGVVRSMADKTMRRSADLADFRVRYSDRLAALARVQGLLSRLAEGQRITFDELVHAEITALDGAAERATATGPKGVALRSSTVQTFALALHELATNAVKYGAFAQPQGRLEIRWRVERAGTDGRRWLHVDWRERDVRMPAAGAGPQGGGSGRELIERALPYQLGARTTYVMAADGVHCTIALPVSDRGAAREPTDA